MATRRPSAKPRRPVAPVNVFDDDELLDDASDLQPATTSVQLANAINSAPAPTLHPASAPSRTLRPQPPSPPADEPAEPEDDDHIAEEPAYDPAEVPEPSPAPAPTRRPRASPRAILSPTSVAAFDPLVSPATRSTASRALAKRSSLALPSPARTRQGSDPFALVEPAPPPYEQVLQSDDLIDSQFRQLSVADADAATQGPAVRKQKPAAAHARQPRRHEEEVKQAVEVEVEQEEEEEAVEAEDHQEPEPEPEPAPVKPRVVRRAARASAARVARRVVEAEAMEEEEPIQPQRAPARMRRSVPQPTQLVDVEEAAMEEEDDGVEDETQWRHRQKPVIRVRHRMPHRGPPHPHPVLHPSVDDDGEEDVAVPPPRARVVKRTKPVELKQQREEEEEEEAEDAQDQPHPTPKVRPTRRVPSTQRRQPIPHPHDDAAFEDEKLDTPRHRPAPRRSVPASSRADVPVLFRPVRVRVDALAFMKAGTPFLKYTSSFLSSPPHFRQFQLFPSVPARIVWFSENKPLSDTSIPLSSITSIALGQTTPTFQRHRAVELESMSFSVLYTDDRARHRSLDLTAKDRNELQIWALGLDRAVKLVRAGKDLEGRRRVVVEIKVVYGGSPSQQIVEVDTGRVVDTRKRSEIRGGDGEELEGVGRVGGVDSSLYRELQPRFASLQVTLGKRKEDLKRPAVQNSALHGNVKAMVRKVEDKTRVIAEALMDGELALADSQLWLASIELDSVGAMIHSIK